MCVSQAAFRSLLDLRTPLLVVRVGHTTQANSGREAAAHVVCLHLMPGSHRSLPPLLLVRGAAQLPAGQPLTISKPDIVITAAAEFDPAGGPFEGPALAVACGGLKTLVTIK